jgi:hypothetical protein
VRARKRLQRLLVEADVHAQQCVAVALRQLQGAGLIGPRRRESAGPDYTATGALIAGCGS